MPPLAIHLPDYSIGNPYQALLAEGLRQQGVEVRFENFPASSLPLNRIISLNPKAHVLHLHWVPSFFSPIMWSRNNFKAWIRLTRIMLDVVVARLRGVKVVWTVHNIISHESPNEHREIVARRWLARCVTHLIFHSSSARQQVNTLLDLETERKSSIVPHGNYIDVYPVDKLREDEMRSELGIAEDEIVVLFFGAIRRYKGVNSLIEAFTHLPNRKIRLIIAGRLFDKSLESDLRERCATDSRISLILGFLPECDVAPLHALSDLVAIPFERTLTSGSAILAASLGKALLLPEDARVIELPSFDGTIFFTSPLSLRSALAGLDATSLREMGRFNLSMIEKLKWNDIGRELTRVYAHR